MSILILLLFVMGVGGAGFIYLRSVGSGNPMAVTARLGRYGYAGIPGAQGSGQIIAPIAKQRSEQSGVSRTADMIADKGGMGKPIARKLERADLKWTPGEFLVVYLAVIVVLILVGILIRGALGLLAGGLLGAVVPWVYLAKRGSKRQNKFLEQLPDMSQMMGNSMRAGFSIVQSMELVASEGPSPAADEFERVIAEVKLGLPLDQALEHLQHRMPSEDLELAVIAINVQRQVGGNLAEILMVISKTVRDRVRFKRDLKALTAQARYSSYIITGLPIAVAIVINLMDQPYESFLYKTAIGHLMIGGAIIMLCMGFFFLNKIATIEV